MNFNSVSDLFDYIKRDKYLVSDAAWTEDKHSHYKAGDRVMWKSGLHEKQSNGKWKKVSGYSHPIKEQGYKKVRQNGKVKLIPCEYTFNINRSNLKENKEKLRHPVVQIKSGEFTSPTAKDAGTKAKEWMRTHVGDSVDSVIGKIDVSDNCMDDTFGHTKYPSKYDTVKAIKPVLTRGVYLGNMLDLTGDDIVNHYFAAKIKIDGKDKFVYCRVRKSISNEKAGNRFYLHSVYTEDDIKKGVRNKAVPIRKGKVNSGTPLEKSVILNFLNCK